VSPKDRSTFVKTSVATLPIAFLYRHWLAIVTAGFTRNEYKMCATMKTSVCYRIVMLGEQYETCCSICKFENRKRHQH
jgi:hypothetical protein